MDASRWRELKSLRDDAPGQAATSVGKCACAIVPDVAKLPNRYDRSKGNRIVIAGQERPLARFAGSGHSDHRRQGAVGRIDRTLRLPIPQDDVHFRIVLHEVQLSALRKSLVAVGTKRGRSPRTYGETVSQSLALPGN